MTVPLEDDMLAVRLAPRIVDKLPDATLVVDRTGSIRVVNGAAVRLTGWPRPDLLHQDVEVLIPEGLRGRHQELRSAFMVAPADRPMGQGVLIDLLHHDGQLVPVEILLGVLDGADDLYVVATIRRRGSP